MAYEREKNAVKLPAKAWKDGHDHLYSRQTYDIEKSAPAGEPPTGGVVEPDKSGQSKITFGQVKNLFNLPSNYHSATKVTVVSEKSRLEAEESARFLKKVLKHQRKTRETRTKIFCVSEKAEIG